MKLLGKFIYWILGFVFIVFLIIVVALVFGNNSDQTWENFDSQPLKSNIKKAFKQIDLKASDIKQIYEVDPWSSGPRYKVEYSDGTTYYIYAYDNGQIESIRTDLQGDPIYSIDSVDFGNGDENAIILKEGELGDYGKNVTYDGENYIKYFLPEGTYEVEALTRNAMFFIEDTTIYKNSSGYDESEILDTIELSDVGSKQTITLPANSCINLVVNTAISLKKIG